MRVSLNWIREFVKVEAAPQEIADRLTMAGLEIEGIETMDGEAFIDVGGLGKKENEMVFEVNVTPNRPDCLSMLGIAREVAAAFRLPLDIPPCDAGAGLPASGIKVEIADMDLCHRYAGRQISGVKVCESPQWMKKRLEHCGIRAINNIVDVTNYVLLEFGHPLHAFDADKLANSRIRVARAGQGARITTLDGAEREIRDDSLLIWDGRNPVAVAGVMGGEDSAVTDSTTNIFLESAYFEPTSIRRTSKYLGLKSESSYRFERGTDIEFLEKALDRAALLMQETGGGTIHDIVDVYPSKYVPHTFEVSPARISRLIGVEIPRSEMLDILNRIGLKAEERGEKIAISPPAWRRDIRHTVDVVEEVARIYGFGNIPAVAPRTALSAAGRDTFRLALDKTKDAIRKTGFTEAINYSFMNTEELDLLLLSENDSRRKYITVMNPLRQEDAAMRTTLIPALIRSFLHNVSRGVRDIRFYEISKVFINEGGRLPEEKLRLSGIFYRDKSPAIWKQDMPSFYLVKGALETVFEELGINGLSYSMTSEKFLHIGKASDISVGGFKAGYAGELGPAVIEKLDLKLNKPEIVVFELDLDLILSYARTAKTYSQIPRFPAIERDIALLLDDRIDAETVRAYFLEYQSGLIESVELFDYYKGKNLPQDKKSLAFRVIYRASDRTLTDAEIEPVHKELVDSVIQKTGGELRGV